MIFFLIFSSCGIEWGKYLIEVEEGRKLNIAKYFIFDKNNFE
jgi:hypothetical protein